LQLLLFIFYFLLFVYFISRIEFFKQSGLPVILMAGLFSLKIMAACLNTLYYSASSPGGMIGGDSGNFYYSGIEETGILLQDPLYFFNELFHHHYNSAGNLFLENSYWNDLKSMFMIKLVAICNVVTFKSYWSDILFFNFFFFFGLIAFFRFVSELFPGRKWLLVLSVFCIPTFLFWCSSIHKDGLVFTAIGLIFYSFHHCIEKGFTFKRCLVVVLSMLLLFIVRNYVCFLFLPVLFSWWLAVRSNIKPLSVFVPVYIFILVFFFTSSAISPALNFPQYIVSRQHAFTAIGNHTKVAVPLLLPTFRNFIFYLPAAIDMAILRPHLSEIKSWLYYPLLMELYALFILCLFCFFFRKRSQCFPVAGWAGMIFAFSILLMIGYTVTFSGAVMRYRSLVFPIIITLSVGCMDINRFRLLRRLKEHK
jgi:hypothetical protein